MRKLVRGAVTALLVALLPFILSAQISITTAGTTENFNAMGSGTALPANWKMSTQGQGNISGYATGTNITAVTQVASSGTPATGGAYNWGTTAGTDRAIGFMTSGGYASPNSIMAYYRNTSGTVINSLSIGFSIEQYRTNTTAATIAFSISTDGANWQPVPGNVSFAAAGASTYNFSSVTTVTRTAFVNNLSVANNSDIYLRWVFTTGASNSQGLGLDDVQVTVSPVVTATLKDILSTDVNSDGLANPGDGLTYATTIKNAGPGNATNVTLTAPAPTNTTFVPGSVKTSPLARNDTFATSFNTTLNGSTVLANDFGMPAPTVVSFGPTANSSVNAAGASGITDMGGTLSVQTNGTFTYTPANNFTGADKFAYKAGNGNLPNNDGFVVINVAPDITFTTVNVNPACNAGITGSITFTASGGTGILTYSITGAAGTYQASNTFTGLAAGTYNLAVKDASGYIKTGTATLTEPAAINFTTTNADPLCNAGTTGSITITATGGTGALTYSKDNGANYQASNVFSGLAAGTYNLVVKDASNCTKTGSVTLTNPAAVNFTTSVSAVLCNGGNTGSITVTATGGVGTLTYSKDNGTTYQASNVFNNLTAATYNLVVKDANNCTKTGTATVTEPAVLVVNGVIPNLTYTVAMATVTFTKTGGTGAATWSASGLPTGIGIAPLTGALSGAPTQTGSFSATITATDANGCVATKTIAFTVAPKLTGDAYDAVGNTQLVADGHSTPTTPFTTDADNIITNDASDAAITLTAVTNATTTNGGTISILANGKFIYTPKAGSTAADSYVYTATSSGVPATATISFTVANMVWYVNNTNAGTADGRSNTPFANVGLAATVSAANDYIYVHTGSGSTTGNAVLKSGQTLRGAGSALTVGALSIAAGTKPTLTGAITLANSVTVDGFDMNTGTAIPLTSSGATSVNVNIGNVTSSGAANAVTLTNTTGTVIIAGGTQTNSTGATFNISGGTLNLIYSGGISQAANAPMVNISGGHATGTITFQTGTLSATNGTGLQFDNADGTYNFNGTTTLNGGDAGIDLLNDCDGNFTFSANTSITNPSGAAFVVGSAMAGSGGACSVDYNGTISKSNAGRAVDIQQKTSGTVSFDGTIGSTGSSTGINLLTNGTSVFSFTGGLTLNTGATAAFTAIGGSTLTITGTNTVTTTSAVGLEIQNINAGASGITFSSITTTSGIVAYMATSTGTKTLGTINRSAGAGLFGLYLNNSGTVNAGSASISTLTNSTGTGIEINNTTLNLNGVGVDISTTSGIGVNCTGGTVAITGGNLNITTSTGTGFNATAGTISLTGSNNTISSGTGTALNILNTVIGASDLTFQSISANGAANGIVLNNTGASGGLTVSGTGTASSGGTIQNTTSHGISLTTTRDASFNNMNIQNTAGSGVRGTTAVTNFTFTNGTINNSGTGGGNQESSIAFNDPTGSATDAKVTGTVTITGNTLTNARWHGVSILQFAGTLDDVNISNNTLTSGLTTGGGGNSLGSGIQLVAGGVAATVASVTRAELNNNTITNFPGGVPMALQGGTANGSGPVGTFGTPGNTTNDIEVMGNILNGGGATIKPNQIILATVNGRGVGNFNIQNNGTVGDPLSGSAGNIIDISAGGSVTVKAIVSGNRIDAAGQTVSGTSGIAAGVGPFDVTGSGTLSTATLYAIVQNNFVSNSAGTGIRLNVNAGDPTLNAVVTGNTVGAPISTTYGIQIVQGANPGFTGNTNLQISGNTSAGGTGGGNTWPGIGLRKFSAASGEFNIVGLSPSPANNAQMEAYVSGQNPGSASGTFGTGGTAAVNGSSNNWTNIASVPTARLLLKRNQKNTWQTQQNFNDTWAMNYSISRKPLAWLRLSNSH